MLKGEALRLKWSDINFKNSLITFKRTRDGLEVRPPKTRNSYRSLQIDQEVIVQLNKYKKWCKKSN